MCLLALKKYRRRKSRMTFHFEGVMKIEKERWYTMKLFDDGLLFINGERHNDPELVEFFEQWEKPMKGFIYIQADGAPYFTTTLDEREAIDQR